MLGNIISWLRCSRVWLRGSFVTVPNPNQKINICELHGQCIVGAYSTFCYRGVTQGTGETKEGFTMEYSAVHLVSNTWILRGVCGVWIRVVSTGLSGVKTSACRDLTGKKPQLFQLSLNVPGPTHCQRRCCLMLPNQICKWSEFS